MSTCDWQKVVGELSSTPRKGKTARVHQKLKATRDVPVPFPTREPSPVNLPATESDECREGGTQAINFLLAKAVSPTAQPPAQKSLKEWSYHDLARLNPQELELWRTTCNEELDTLKSETSSSSLTDLQIEKPLKTAGFLTSNLMEGKRPT
jgi:hypothetical protein